MRRAPLTISAVIAAGVHLFPFRTEQLSPPAPMVLGGQPPGRVGRRRINFARAGFAGSCSFRSKCRVFAPRAHSSALLLGEPSRRRGRAALSSDVHTLSRWWRVSCMRPRGRPSPAAGRRDSRDLPLVRGTHRWAARCRDVDPETEAARQACIGTERR